MTTNLASQFPNKVSPITTLQEKGTKSEWTPTQAVEGIIVVNNLYQIIGWNPIASYISKFERESIINTSILDLLATEEAKKAFIADFDRLTNVSEKLDLYYESTVEICTPSGKVRPVTFQWNRMIVNGVRLFNICIASVLENKELLKTYSEKEMELAKKEKELAKLTSSNQQLESFAYVASHDLKEPLRSIGNFTQLLGKRLGDKLDETDKEFFSFVTSGVKNMNSLIEDLLTYSRVNSGKNEMTAIKPADSIAVVINGLNQRVIETNAQIHVKALPTQITGNPTKFKQLLQNLIANAIKFQNPEKDPVITIQGKEERDQWIFSVSDNGIGIKEEYYQKVFGIFTKLHHKSVYPGSGIGLSVCQRIVEQHDGEIWVDSVFGEGTNFYFSISKNLCKNQNL